MSTSVTMVKIENPLMMKSFWLRVAFTLLCDDRDADGVKGEIWRSGCWTKPTETVTLL